MADGGTADLVSGNNVLAHTPNQTDFVDGVAILLKPEGTATFEFPHLVKLIEQVQFDTIYHERFSYFSLRSVQAVFRRAGLEIVDVEELASAGGSLRVFEEHTARGTLISLNVDRLLASEYAFGIRDLHTYRSFAAHVAQLKYKLLKMLVNGH